MENYKAEIVTQKIDGIVLKVHDIPEDDGYIPRHFHPEIELSYTKEGVTKEYYIDDKIYQINAEEVVYVNPYEINGVNANNFENPKHSVLVILISQEFIHKNFPEMLTIKVVKHHIKACENKELFEILDELFNIAKKTELDTILKMEQKILILKLMVIFYKNYSEPLVTIDNKNSQQPIFKIMIFLNDHFQEPIKMIDLKNKFYLSEGYLARYFKKVTGISIFEYLETIRLTHATTMLKNGKSSIDDIAHEVGFYDRKALEKAFKKRYYTTPAKWRREQ